MKRVILKELSLENFKGIKAFEGSFGDITEIYGENGTGKTTIADSFFWLLFDKDSEDKKEFDIKPIDSEGNVIHGLESKVTGTLEIDGRLTILQKIYKEKWTKKRGEAEKVFTGNETLYFVNDVPVKKSEYQDTIKEIIQEDLFKLITNPLYFSTKLKWQERRNILMQILGDIEDQEVINSSAKLKELESLLENNPNPDVDTLKKSVSAKKKRLNDEIKSIPIRVDECNKSKKDLDFKSLELEKEKINTELEELKEGLNSGAVAEKNIVELKKELYSLQDKAGEIEREEKKKSELPGLTLIKEKEELEKNLSQLLAKDNEIRSLMPNKQLFITLANRVEDYRKQFRELSKKEFVFDESKGICPTCKRELDNVNQIKEELESNFNINKANQLDEIRRLGKQAKGSLESNNKKHDSANEKLTELSIEINNMKEKITEKQVEITNFKPVTNLVSNKTYIEIKHRISEIESELAHSNEDNSKDVLKTKIRDLELKLDGANSQIAYKEHNSSMELRVKELMEKERELAEQIAELEKQEFLCEEFVKTKVNLLENSINQKFKNVTFKLFDTQVNGGLIECCEALVNGVPFSSANNASKYNAGLDIINTLCNYYQVSAPILIDNREGINNIIPVESQIINLRVSKDKELKIC